MDNQDTLNEQNNEVQSQVQNDDQTDAQTNSQSSESSQTSGNRFLNINNQVDTNIDENNAKTPINYTDDPSIQANLKTQKTQSISIDWKVLIIIGIVLFIFILFLPNIFEYVSHLLTIDKFTIIS